jgi:hypothetical protein
MPRGGHNRKSAETHKLNGTFTKARHSKARVPTSYGDITEPPYPLDDEVRVIYDNLCIKIKSVGQDHSADTYAIALLAQLLADLKVERKAANVAQVVVLFKQLALTPAARATFKELPPAREESRSILDRVLAGEYQ